MRRGRDESHGSGGGVVLEFPSDWKETIGALAKYFHFPPSELWEFEMDDLVFWSDRMSEQVKELEKRMKK